VQVQNQALFASLPKLFLREVLFAIAPVQLAEMVLIHRLHVAQDSPAELLQQWQSPRVPARDLEVDYNGRPIGTNENVLGFAEVVV
jgi:hypothetical protein